MTFWSCSPSLHQKMICIRAKSPSDNSRRVRVLHIPLVTQAGRARGWGSSCATKAHRAESSNAIAHARSHTPSPCNNRRSKPVRRLLARGKGVTQRFKSARSPCYFFRRVARLSAFHLKPKPSHRFDRSRHITCGPSTGAFFFEPVKRSAANRKTVRILTTSTIPGKEITRCSVPRTAVIGQNQ